MERGETLMKALQEAVPDDVRGKLTTTATEIIQAQKSNLSLNVLKRVGWTNHPLDSKPKIPDNSIVKDTLTCDSEVKDANTLPENSVPHHENPSSAEMATQEGETTATVPKAQEQHENTEQLVSSEGGQRPTSDGAAAVPKVQQQQENTQQSVSSEGGQMPNSDGAVTVPKAQEQQENTQQLVSSEGGQRPTLDGLPMSNDMNTPKDEVKRMDAPTIEKSSLAESHNLDSHEKVLPQHEEAERQVNETSKSRDVSPTPSNAAVEPNLPNNPSKIEEPPRVASQSPINVSQALDALTGFDDSTQMAVNSVFGVIENMIEQLEKKQENNEVESDAESSKYAEDQNTEVRKEESKNEVKKVGQDEINRSFSSNGIKDDSQKETSKNSSMSSLKSRSNQEKEKDLSHDHLKQDILKRLSNAQNLHWSMQYSQYFPEYVQKQLEVKEVDSDTATVLFLDPQERTWKMVSQAQSSDDDSDTSSQQDNVIEPSYVILENSTNESSNEEEDNKFVATREQVALFLREKLLGALETEVLRKLCALHQYFEEIDVSLVHDIEELATSVSEKVVLNSELNLELFSRHDIPTGIIGRIQSEYLIKTVSCAVHEANHIRRLFPMGLIVGSVLACLRKYFEINESHGNGENKLKEGNVPNCYDSLDGENDVRRKEVDLRQEEGNGEESESSSAREEKLAMGRRRGQGIMVGTVTAALGASALLVQHQVSIL
jgi:uncharacterized protein